CRPGRRELPVRADELKPPKWLARFTYGELLTSEDVFGSNADDFGGPPGGPGGNDTPEFTFKFVPGTPASLTIEADDAGFGGNKQGGPNPQELQQAKAMAPMFAGMRQTLMVKVDGKVTETTAEIPLGKSGNTFVLADMQIDKMFANDKLLQEMIKLGDGPPDKTINYPEFKLQNTKKPVVIKFQ
ncbi:MAG: hypothetical protein AAF492_15510, partial [Verrucomicrobiota bacterium]